jgi:hypothetical protein
LRVGTQRARAAGREVRRHARIEQSAEKLGSNACRGLLQTLSIFSDCGQVGSLPAGYFCRDSFRIDCDQAIRVQTYASAAVV